MTDTDDFDDIPENADEDISSLEDNDNIEEEDIIESGMDLASLAVDTPIYRLKLPYSNETFLAIYEGGPLYCGARVIVPTRYGKDLARVTGPARPKGAFAASGKSDKKINKIERLAAKEEIERAESNKKLEDEALNICKKKIEECRRADPKNPLDMKLVSAHYLLDDPRLLFFFTSENRVDFRELVKDLVAVFKTRIELRQIGVRDEARVLGGLGMCGNPYCCHAVSDRLKPVSIKMAKEQNMSLNSTKISGVCGRLLCCLAFEHNFYSEQRKLIPQEGVRFTHDKTSWKIVEVNMVTGAIRASSEDDRQIQLSASQFERVDDRWRLKKTAIGAIAPPGGA
jgi:cell fate regulator YaaT (PSP1 superfamily)